MNTNSFFEKHVSLLQDYDTIIKLHTATWGHGDKLAVNQGKLEISPGGFLQAPTRTIKNLLYGGYNRDAVTIYLEGLVSKTSEFLKSLETDSSMSPTDWNFIIKKIDTVTIRMNDLQYEYRAIKGWFNDKTCERLSKIYNDFHLMRENLKKNHKDTLEKLSELHDKKPLNITEVLDLKNIPIPLGKNLEEIVQCAEIAEKHLLTFKQKLGVFFKTLLIHIVAAPIIVSLGILKIYVWNPFELIATGKIYTQNPINWFLTELKRANRYYERNEPKECLERYANGILETPIITDEHIKAFERFSCHVTEHGISNGLLNFGSKNIDELWSITEASSPKKSYYGTTALEIISELFKQSTAEMIHLSVFTSFLRDNHEYLKWINNYEKSAVSDKDKINDFEEDFVLNGNYEDSQAGRKKYFIDLFKDNNPFNTTSRNIRLISPQNFCKMIKAIGNNSAIKKIWIPQYGKYLKNIKDVLAKHQFRRDGENESCFIR